MITIDEIDNFIDKIPPAPKALKETLALLSEGELMKAAKVAEQEIVLRTYLKNLVNKPVYGFQNEVNEVSQIFGILGVAGSQQAVYNYMLTLLSPEKWVLFDLNEKIFYELQAELSVRYNKILKHLKITDKDIQSAISLVPASIIVAEAFFKNHKNDVELIKTTSALDYNTILKRLSGMDLFDICERISMKWEMPSKVSQVLQTASGIKPSSKQEINNVGKWIHLLLFYELSQPIFIEAGLNDFIDFQVDFVQDIYEEFIKIMEVER